MRLFTTQQELADFCECSPRTIERYLDKIATHGFLQVETVFGAGLVTVKPDHVFVSGGKTRKSTKIILDQDNAENLKAIIADRQKIYLWHG